MPSRAVQAPPGAPIAPETTLSETTLDRPPMFRRSLQSLTRRLGSASVPLVGPRRSPTETLVLFFNTMWGEAIDPDATPLPAGCRITTDLGCFNEAAAVV